MTTTIYLTAASVEPLSLSAIMPTETDIFDLFIGDDWSIPFEFDPAANITGFALAFRLYLPNAEAPVIEKTLADGDIVVTNAATGVGTIEVPADETEDLEPIRYYFECARTDAGNKKVYGYGKIVLQHRT